MGKVIYSKQPERLQNIGGGAYYYNWDIKRVENVQDDGQTIVQYECEQVKVFAPLTRNKVKEAVIQHLWGNGVEEKYINDYNAAVLGLGDEADIDKYKGFLTERERVKALVEEVL